MHLNSNPKKAQRALWTIQSNTTGSTNKLTRTKGGGGDKYLKALC